MIEGLTVAFGGLLGALAKDCLADNRLQLPYFENGYVVLGSLGGMLVGAFVGFAIDGNFLTALLAGYTGTSAIGYLIQKSPAIRKKKFKK